MIICAPYDPCQGASRGPQMCISSFRVLFFSCLFLGVWVCEFASARMCACMCVLALMYDRERGCLYVCGLVCVFVRALMSV